MTAAECRKKAVALAEEALSTLHPNLEGHSLTVDGGNMITAKATVELATAEFWRNLANDLEWEQDPVIKLAEGEA